jgi:hypothetical protein
MSLMAVPLLSGSFRVSPSRVGVGDVGVPTEIPPEVTRSDAEVRDYRERWNAHDDPYRPEDAR